MVCTKTGEGWCGCAAFCESGSRTLFPDDRSQGGPESSKLLEAPSLDQPWRSPASPLREARGNCSSRRSISLAIQGPKLDDEKSHRQSPHSVCTTPCVSSTVTCAVCVIATARGAKADAGGALPRPPGQPALTTAGPRPRPAPRRAQEPWRPGPWATGQGHLLRAPDCSTCPRLLTSCSRLARLRVLPTEPCPVEGSRIKIPWVRS